MSVFLYNNNISVIQKVVWFNDRDINKGTFMSGQSRDTGNIGQITQQNKKNNL
jgi:hypothetical protein